ncbi:hypothetical protein [Streptomyces sp. NBC_00620]|uniref:hypothetical protein n=1 Tax=Streptomyces sp. NBC_00620 TaxID=2903666 RepID=UPI002258C93D|nr:hypothetical protein [Streptomyces sp. NBC_00620]MCX4976496.1 hypothetical protein [Streptomyces sp. NBC_00620]
MSDPSPFRPVRGAAFNAFGPSVILAATVTVNGETVTVQQDVDRAVWQRISSDPRLRADYERSLRQGLAAAVVERLNPSVTVHVPVPPGEAVSAALKRADATMRDEAEPEAEHCRRVELGSEG